MRILSSTQISYLFRVHAFRHHYDRPLGADSVVFALTKQTDRSSGVATVPPSASRRLMYLSPNDAYNPQGVDNLTSLNNNSLN